MNAKRLRIPYNVQDFRRVRDEGLYYIDKTVYIERLESITDLFLFFVRPRRFGKSLFLDMLSRYYDINQKENFEKWFGDLYIGSHPTELANAYQVMKLDFSQVMKEQGKDLEEKFNRHIGTKLKAFYLRYRKYYSESGLEGIVQADTLSAAGYFGSVMETAADRNYKLYLFIDEYDNFTNDLVAGEGKKTYLEITHKTGFYRNWFKAFKGTFHRIFMTGVSPVTLDDLTSGFSIATNITQKPAFNAMIGFTKDETRKLYEDFNGTGLFHGDVDEHLDTVRRYYDGYCFASDAVGQDHVFNSEMAFYYLKSLVDEGHPPEDLVDRGIRTEFGKLRMLLRAQKVAEEAEGLLPLTEELAAKGEVTFDLKDGFQLERIAEAQNFKSLYFYYGIVTKSRFHRGHLMFRVPNECVRLQVFEHMRAEYERLPSAVDLTDFTDKFDGFAWDGDWQSLFLYLARKFRETSSVRDADQLEAHVNSFMRAYLTMRSVYMVKPELETNLGYSDYAFFPDSSLSDGNRPERSLVMELKSSKADASDAEIARKHDEAVAQLMKYSRDANLPKLAAGTPVTYLCYEFKGFELVRLCEIDPADGSVRNECKVANVK